MRNFGLENLFLWLSFLLYFLWFFLGCFGFLFFIRFMNKISSFWSKNVMQWLVERFLRFFTILYQRILIFIWLRDLVSLHTSQKPRTRKRLSLATVLTLELPRFLRWKIRSNHFFHPLLFLLKKISLVSLNQQHKNLRAFVFSAFNLTLDYPSLELLVYYFYGTFKGFYVIAPPKDYYYSLVLNFRWRWSWF